MTVTDDRLARIEDALFTPQSAALAGGYFRRQWLTAAGCMDKPLAEVTPAEVMAVGIVLGSAWLAGGILARLLAVGRG